MTDSKEYDLTTEQSTSTGKWRGMATPRGLGVPGELLPILFQSGFVYETQEAAQDAAQTAACDSFVDETLEEIRTAVGFGNDWSAE